ncbi:GAF domain-containing protein [Loigolactobacillus bifermentans]|uniref:GAF domain-containing protein n=1 Tax=Loigolactobacillus bifermentans TaxID=1607 RepID=UPI00070AE929|nr:GAF domain-containing protein [Loigolactobacillus bifermentans]QGG59838.1 GAF domain-containing protein [Loigolactobacillus bifermentans]
MSTTNTPSLLTQQIDALLTGETNWVTNLANAAALLKDNLTDVSWAGFYIADPAANDLYLGPFQGKVACMHIQPGKGVVGTAYTEQKSQLVPDVHQFQGHIACDSATNSELVVPILQAGQVIALLDLDSQSFDRFKETDRVQLTEFVQALSQHLSLK